MKYPFQYLRPIFNPTAYYLPTEYSCPRELAHEIKYPSVTSKRINKVSKGVERRRGSQWTEANRRELKIDARSVEVPFHPSRLTRQSREKRDIRQEPADRSTKSPVLLFQHVRYKYFSICCLTSCQSGRENFCPSERNGL